MSWPELIFVMVGYFFALWWPHTLGSGVSAELPDRGKFSELFSFCFLDMILKPGIYIWQVARHIKFEFHSNQVSLTHFKTTNRSNSFFYTWPHQLYDSSKFGTYTYKVIFSLIDFCYSWPFFHGGLRTADIFSKLWGNNLKIGLYTL